MSRFSIDWASKDARLRALYAAGETMLTIAEAIGVSRGAVAKRIRQLGLTR